MPYGRKKRIGKPCWMKVVCLTHKMNPGQWVTTFWFCLRVQAFWVVSVLRCTQETNFEWHNTSRFNSLQLGVGDFKVSVFPLLFLKAVYYKLWCDFVSVSLKKKEKRCGGFDLRINQRQPLETGTSNQICWANRPLLQRTCNRWHIGTGNKTCINGFCD